MGNTLISAIDVASSSLRGETLRAVDYLRVSTEEQKKGYGIAYTGKRTANHIRKKGWEYVRTYSDEGYSGSLDHTQRPDLKTLMADAEQVPRPFDVVVVQEERSIGRRDRAFWPWVWKLEDLGIFVAIVRGDYDNTTEAGRSRMRKEADRAEDERITLRDRTQGGRQEKAELGGHDGGVAPYGYRIENQGKRGESRLVLDTGEKYEGYPTLHRAWKHIVREGKTPSEVETLFNSESIPGPTLDYWPRGSLRHVLTSRAIQESKRIFRDPRGGKTKLNPDGTPKYGDSVIINLEPVFNPEELKLLNIALARTSHGPRTSDSVIHPLSKHVYGMCGNYWTGVSWDNAEKVKDRVYRCVGRQSQSKGTEKECTTCTQIDAEALEAKVWNETCKLLEDPDRLRQMSEDWVEMAKNSGVDYAARILELDDQIEEVDETITAITQATARRARRRGLDQQATQDMIERATQEEEEKLESLESLRREAISWQEEIEQNLGTARDLAELAEVARVNLHSMDVVQKENVVDLLGLKITILGPTPRRKTRKGDRISDWFRERERVVPTLTDEAWAIAERVIIKPKGRRPKDPRALLDALFTKARTGCAWADLKYGNVASVFSRWLDNGLWDELMEALAHCPGTPVQDSVVLPPLRIEGRIDPRLFISEDLPLDQDDLFKASRSTTIPFLLNLAA
jgi:DNA invertase Pin-like site-specific DNA recombinase